MPSRDGSTVMAVALWAVLLWGQGLAGEAPVRVRVVDAETGAALPGANVRDTAGSPVAEADGAGWVELIPHGLPDRLVVSRVGYRSLVIDRESLSDVGSTLQLDRKEFQLGAVTVTAQRREVEVFDSPYSASVADVGVVAGAPAQDVADAIQDMAGISVQKSAPGGGAVFLRGMIGNQVLVLVDGVRLNNATYRYGPNQYMATLDPWLMDRAEVVRGPTSVLYGSDAMGGTVQYFTETPSVGEGEWHSSLRAGVRLATTDDERTGRAEWHGSVSNIGWIAGVSRREVGDLRHGSRGDPPHPLYAGMGDTHRPTGWEHSGYDAKVLWRPSATYTLTAAYQGVRQPLVPRYDKYGPGNHDVWTYDPQNRDLGYLRFEGANAGGPVQLLRVTASVHRQSEGRTSHRVGTSQTQRDFDRVLTYGLTAQATSAVGRSHTLTYGVEVYHDDIASRRAIVDTETGTETTTPGLGKFVDGASSTSLGAYAQDEMGITDGLHAVVGLRYSRVRLRAPFPDSGPEDLRFGEVVVDPSAWTGSGGLVWTVAPGVNWVVSAGQAFRAPSMENLAQVGEGDGGYEVPNTEARPERMVSYETGLKVSRERFAVSLSAFYSSISDLLVRMPTTFRGLPYYVTGTDTLDVVFQENAANTCITGVEGSAELRVSAEIRAAGNLTYLYGQDQTNDTPLRRIPPAGGTLTVNWSRGRLEAAGYVRFALKQDRLSPGDVSDLRIPSGGTPGWWTLNASLGAKVRDWIKIQIGIENALDMDYRMHGSGVNGPGANGFVNLYVEL